MTTPIDPPHFNIFISRTDTEVDEVKAIIEKAAPLIWTKEDPTLHKNIKIKRFLLSTSNRVYKCSIGDKHAMVRVYGDGASLLVDRDHEVHVTKLMCQFKLSAQIYCSFDNGYIVEYITGDGIEVRHMSDPAYAKLIARKMAEWHCSLPAIYSSSDTAVPLSPDQALMRGKRGVWVTIHKWLAIATKTVPEEELQVAKLEITELEAQLAVAYATSPLVMCHNDINYGNVLYNNDPECPDHDRVAFVDYEYAAFNFRGFDLGNHFNEYGGLELDFTKYPTREVRKHFARHYVQRCVELGKFTGNIEDEAEHVVVEAEDFSQVSHLFWHVWALVIAHTPDKPGEFDYVKYAALRLKEYFVKKPLLARNKNKK